SIIVHLLLNYCGRFHYRVVHTAQKHPITSRNTGNRDLVTRLVDPDIRDICIDHVLLVVQCIILSKNTNSGTWFCCATQDPSKSMERGCIASVVKFCCLDDQRSFWVALKH